MQKLILFLLLSNGSFFFSQKTFVPDDHFEQFLIDQSFDDVLDDSVLTSNINGLTHLSVVNQFISDLTGIEAFVSLQHLNFNTNYIETLDLSANTSLLELIATGNELENISFGQNSPLKSIFLQGNNLSELDVSHLAKLELLECSVNLLETLDVSQNPSLEHLSCRFNALTELNLTQNPMLEILGCDNNQLEYLNLSSNPFLYRLWCRSNPMQCLNMANGNNHHFIDFATWNTPELTCIIVDTPNWSPLDLLITNPDANIIIDPQNFFSVECGIDCSETSNLTELNSNQPKELIKIANLLGQEVEYTPNTVLIYQYSDGTSEKVFTTAD